MKHHRFGGTAKRYIMENTESQALRPSLGSSSSPPVSSGGSPQPPSRVGHSTHSRPPTPCPPRPSLLTCRPRLPRRAGVAGGGRVPSAASPQPAQPPHLPHAHGHLRAPPARIPPLPPQRGPLAYPRAAPQEKAQPSREHSRLSARCPAPLSGQRGARAHTTHRDYFTAAGGSTHCLQHARALTARF